MHGTHPNILGAAGLAGKDEKAVPPAIFGHSRLTEVCGKREDDFMTGDAAKRRGVGIDPKPTPASNWEKRR